MVGTLLNQLNHLHTVNSAGGLTNRAKPTHLLFFTMKISFSTQDVLNMLHAKLNLSFCSMQVTILRSKYQLSNKVARYITNECVAQQLATQKSNRSGIPFKSAWKGLYIRLLLNATFLLSGLKRFFSLWKTPIKAGGVWIREITHKMMHKCLCKLGATGFASSTIKITDSVLDVSYIRRCTLMIIVQLNSFSCCRPRTSWRWKNGIHTTDLFYLKSEIIVKYLKINFKP